MKTKRRYHFWRVFWVVLALYVLFALIGILAASFFPNHEKDVNYDKFFTLANCIRQLYSLFFSAFFYYFTLNAFYRLFREKKSTIHFLRVSLVAIGVLMVYYVSSVYFESKVTEELRKQITTAVLIFSFTISTIFYMAFALLIPYFTYLRDEKKQQKILEEQKMQLEVEKSQANFNFLKAQINPHFLHNTLNFLYSKSLPYSPELSEGILTLSDIMRYALSEGNAKDGKAPLKDEIEHVRNVVKIQQLRFSNTLNVQLEVSGVMNGAQIIPFVLITLVENAFKHGDLKDTSSPIIVKVNVENNQLYFYCFNKKKLGPKELSTGIGLDNIKKRLDLAYGNNYTFNIKDQDGYYTTELIIKKL